jgi:uncharacterized membrane protein (TIGR02234 family)
MRRSVQFGAALACDVLGAAGALLAATRPWQVVRLRQPPPLPDELLSLSGRTVDAAVTALAVVALAGAVAVLATRGAARRVVGVVLVLAGGAVVWRAVAASSAVSAARARTLLLQHHPGAPIGSGNAPHVSSSLLWPIVTVICGSLILVAGVLVSARGHRWASLSSRYESQTADAGAEGGTARAAASMWNALDRGDDPTAPQPDDSESGPAH